MSTVRMGLIGYGAWGSHHARAISATPDARLVAIAAHSPESCSRARSEYPEAKVYADYQEMLAGETLDAVDVVLPSHLHHDAGDRVLLSGRHLLLEKPMALRLEDCNALIRRASERNLVLAIGHELRVSPLWGEVKRRIDLGSIGTPLHALIELWRRPYRLGSDGWRYDIGRVGSWILEEPIHFFDLARWYFSDVGDPISLYAKGNGRRADQPNLLDNFCATLGFSDGRFALITQTLAGWEHHQTVKITGTEGALWASWSGAMDRTFEPTFSLKLQQGDRLGSVPLRAQAGEVYELVEQVQRFVQAIREGTPVPCDGEEGKWSVALCLKAEESLRDGNQVSLTGI